MPTTYPRTQVTKTPRVERILQQGRQQWPDQPDSAILVALAEKGAALPRRSDGLLMLPSTPGRVVTNEMVTEWLADD